MAKERIKLAGPATCGERTDCYKVISTTGTLRVRPGDVLSEHYVKRHLFTLSQRCTVDVVEPNVKAMHRHSNESDFNPSRFVE